MEICSQFQACEKMENGYLIKTNCADIRIIFVTEEIVRIRVSFDRQFDEASYVLATTAWEDRLDDVMKGERHRIEAVMPDVEDGEEEITFVTAKLKMVFHKNSIGFCLYNERGELLHSDLDGNPFLQDSNHRIQHFFKMEEEDCFYGFGEKTGKLNKNKAFLRIRATDAMGYHPEKMDTLYKHIPFFIRLSRESKSAVGYFYHNFYESVFNLGCEKSNYWSRYAYFQADGGDIDLFLIGGNTLARVIDNYTLLTGRPALLPKRGLGYQGSSMYYPELEKDSDDAVLDFIDTIKEEGFPIDGFHLSSGYTSVENKRCVFTWNTDRFKNPKDYFARMNEKGVQNVPNVKPGILLCHPYFQEFVEKDVFVKDSVKDTYAVGRWWGGPGAFWDYTKEAARDTWKEYLKKNVIEVGTNSVWNDNCEYDSLIDKDARCDYDGKGGTIGQLKPLMSTIMCKLARDAVKEHDENARPYVVCRSGSAGIQKYAQTWCGDNYTSWESLKYNIPIILGMGLSGQPNEGADIGGFAGPAPSEELFLRWVQHGIFQPRFSIHSASNDNTVTEPWMYHRTADLIKKAIYLRYSLLPYLYSYEYLASLTGAPIMRPLCFEFQKDEKCLDESFTFMFGRDILVANVLEQGATGVTVYLPAGSNWYLWNEELTFFEGGQTVDIPVTLESIPMFIREGAIIPKATNQLMSMEKDKITGLSILIAPGVESEFTLYNDDGVSFDYQKGVFQKTNIRVSGKEVVRVSFENEGTYEDTVEDVMIELIRKDKSPFWIMLGSNKLTHYLSRHKFEKASEGWYYSQTKKAVLIKYPNPKKNTVLTVSFENFDLVGM